MTTGAPLRIIVGRTYFSGNGVSATGTLTGSSAFNDLSTARGGSDIFTLRYATSSEGVFDAIGFDEERGVMYLGIGNEGSG
jgi:hypothetical protein